MRPHERMLMIPKRCARIRKMKILRQTYWILWLTTPSRWTPTRKINRRTSSDAWMPGDSNPQKMPAAHRPLKRSPCLLAQYRGCWPSFNSWFLLRSFLNKSHEDLARRISLLHRQSAAWWIDVDQRTARSFSRSMWNENVSFSSSTCTSASSSWYFNALKCSDSSPVLAAVTQPARGASVDRTRGPAIQKYVALFF